MKGNRRSGSIPLRDLTKRSRDSINGLRDGDLEPFESRKISQEDSGSLKTCPQKTHRKEIKYIKGQITGPITFGLSLTDQEQKPIFYDPTLRDILVKHLSFKARWMEKRYSTTFFPEITTIIFFDEPSLSSFGLAFSGLNREEVILSLNECFDAVKGLKGVHCCGNTDWSVLLSDEPRYPEFRCLWLS